MAKSSLPKDVSVTSSLDLITTRVVTDAHVKALITVAKKATPGELLWFAHFCNRYQLDPFADQVYFIKRRQKTGRKDADGNDVYEDVPKIQVGIGGRLKIAERTGTFTGISAWLIRNAAGKITGAGARASRKDGAVFEEEIAFDEFAQDNHMWRKMPGHMIKKCAKNLVLKQGWPLRAEDERFVELLPDDGGATDDDQATEARDVTPSPVASTESASADVGAVDRSTVEPAQAEPLRAASEVMPAPGDAICNIGKSYRGWPLKKFGPENLLNYANWVADNMPATAERDQFLLDAEAYLKSEGVAV